MPECLEEAGERDNFSFLKRLLIGGDLQSIYFFVSSFWALDTVAV